MKTLHPIRALYPILAMLAFSMSIPSAAGTLEDIAARGAIRLGYSETKAPFSFRLPKVDEPSGFSVELCRRVVIEVVRRLGRPVALEWVPVDPGDRLEAVAEGRVDLECGSTTTTLSRRERVDFSLPIFVDSATLMARADAARRIADLQGRRVAVTEATTTVGVLEAALGRRGVSAELVFTRTLADAFELLRAGSVDAIAGDRTALVGSFVAGRGADGLGIFEENLSYEPYALTLRRGDAAFRLLVDTVLARLYRTREIDSILGAWLAPFGDPTDVLVLMYQLNGLPE